MKKYYVLHNPEWVDPIALGESYDNRAAAVKALREWYAEVGSEEAAGTVVAELRPVVGMRQELVALDGAE